MAADIAAAGRAATGPLALPDIISLAALTLSARLIAPAIRQAAPGLKSLSKTSRCGNAHAVVRC